MSYQLFTHKPLETERHRDFRRYRLKPGKSASPLPLRRRGFRRTPSVKILHPQRPVCAQTEAAAIKAAIYWRVAREPQIQGNGWHAQEASCVSCCQQRGIEVSAVQHDVGSGNTLDRPGLQDILRMARAGMFDILIVTKLDRLARSFEVLSTIRNVLEAQHISLVCVNEPTAMQDFTPVLGLEAVDIDEVTHRNIRERIGRAYRYLRS